MSRLTFFLFIFSRIKKRRKPKVKLVTLLLCEVKKSRSSCSLVVYLQQIKKKAKAEGKTCHAKTMLSLEKSIKLL